MATGTDRYMHQLYAGFPAHHPSVKRSRLMRVLTAACWLMRRGPFTLVGGFDRAFINGQEDVDLCPRLGQRGHDVHFCHECVVYHLESSSRDPTSPREQYNRHLYARRWRDRVEPDCLEYYVADGLPRVGSTSPHYPVQLAISALLAIVDAAGPDVDHPNPVSPRESGRQPKAARVVAPAQPGRGGR